MEALTPEQVARYDETGWLVLERRIPEDVMDGVRAEIDRIVQSARGMTASDDRIDLEDTHRPDAPRVRRIKQPNLQSPVFDALMRSDHVLAPVRDLIGPDLRLHTSKLNMKAAQFGAAVEWHQDWAFYPHNNADVLAVGIVMDDIGVENGPLMVFPGTHKGPTLDHHADGVFAGAIDLAAAGLDPRDADVLTGPAGSISIHHARVIHGSALNRSDRDRRLMFFEIAAADAFPIMGAMTPFASLADFDGRMLCGKTTIEPRVRPAPIRIPQPQPSTQGSIYEIQKALKARAFETAES